MLENRNQFETTIQLIEEYESEEKLDDRLLIDFLIMKCINNIINDWNTLQGGGEVEIYSDLDTTLNTLRNATSLPFLGLNFL